MDSGEPLKLDGVARLLLNEKLYLSALELHTELLHRGSELPVLRDFFNNPDGASAAVGPSLHGEGGFNLLVRDFAAACTTSQTFFTGRDNQIIQQGNFEHLVQITEPVATTPCPLPRTSSVQTLESLDMTRYSEDGEGLMAEKVAVLEFELRKAKDAIRSLRNNLTVVSEHTPDAAVVISASASLAPLQGDDGCRTVVDDLPHSIGGTTACTPGEAPLLPHEQRAVNFLVNEYLLEHNYKLTAITFAEEDDNQGRDFDDWDEVGLNISKPPRLGQLYRKFNRWHSSTRKTSSTELAPPCSMEQKPESCPSIDLPDIVGHAS